MPEMFFGGACLFILNIEKDLAIRFDTQEALATCVDQTRQSLYLDPQIIDVTQPQVGHIDLIPQQIKVSGAEVWQLKDTSKIEEYKELNVTMDWTFCSPYKGTV